MAFAHGINQVTAPQRSKPDKPNAADKLSKAQQLQTVDKKETEEGTPKETNNAAPQSQTRKISFKLNREENRIYVEITDENDEVIRTIPADEEDPRFKAILDSTSPGSIVSDEG